ncbi:GntR family transcriptional regulator [Meiothermus hypogaeus NBRC 106114]|uniref:GntR family transcriptional regulator n=2 Tax=Meiothermus hypogaeus TaxID=884155 RepID=A0A511R0S7_9DEIN|nr:HTH-type transcriptional repressor YtrA [Meiothermus hypogaeus]GEM83229.1 GntR family transcriptional regulator [Meiothermus hypogaeus NBRC 106114]
MWSLDVEAGPIYAQIVRGVERMLASGQMKPGDKLPSARELAASLKVNPNTVIHAYSQLEMARVTETRRGLGTFVREDVNVEGIRLRILQEAALRFWSEVQSLGLGLEDAQKALRSLAPNGAKEAP